MTSKRLIAAMFLALLAGACTTSGGRSIDPAASEPFRIALHEARRTPVPADHPDMKTYLDVLRMLSSEYIRAIRPDELQDAAIRAVKAAGNAPPESGNRRFIHAAVSGMVAKLGDENASVIAGEEYYVAVGNSQYRGGIGVQVDKDPVTGTLRVIAPIEGGPAEQAGLRKDDAIEAIDGQSTATLTLPRATSLLRGPIGSTAELKVRRAGRATPLTVKVPRAQVRIEPVSHHMQDGVAVLRITSFNSASTADRLDAVLADVRRQAGGQLDKAVIDLRRNTGGLVDSVVEVASRLIGRGEVFTTQGRSGRSRRVGQGDEALKGVALVVLVDRNTAVGAEMLAATLQDSQRALIFGERTHGKALIETIASVGSDMAIRIPTATVLRRSGSAIDCNGVLPDLEIGHTPPNAASACPSPATPPKVRYDAAKLCPAVAASMAGRDDSALDCAVEALRDTLAATSLR